MTPKFIQKLEFRGSDTEGTAKLFATLEEPEIGKIFLAFSLGWRTDKLSNNSEPHPVELSYYWKSRRTANGSYIDSEEFPYYERLMGAHIPNFSQAIITKGENFLWSFLQKTWNDVNSWKFTEEGYWLVQYPNNIPEIVRFNWDYVTRMGLSSTLTRKEFMASKVKLLRKIDTD